MKEYLLSKQEVKILSICDKIQFNDDIIIGITNSYAVRIATSCISDQLPAVTTKGSMMADLMHHIKDSATFSIGIVNVPAESELDTEVNKVVLSTENLELYCPVVKDFPDFSIQTFIDTYSVKTIEHELHLSKNELDILKTLIPTKFYVAKHQERSVYAIVCQQDNIDAILTINNS